ncbi:hypothetical protein [Sinimarinibacterium flocculans]|uniref:hypothetical protein n=1 Tax=Sinimarinibacterium flocculans TaxID=985250 RepID=UPI00351935C4
MALASRAAVVALALALACSDGYSDAWDAPRQLDDCVTTYQDEEGGIGDLDVGLTDTRPTEMPGGAVEEAKSPQGTGSLITHGFDTTRTGIGRVVVAVQPRGGKATYLSFDPARSVRARWLNERLVYIQAWWGRIAASELVFDSLERRFLYRKLAHYAYAVDPGCVDLQNRAGQPEALPK